LTVFSFFLLLKSPPNLNIVLFQIIIKINPKQATLSICFFASKQTNKRFGHF